MADPKREPHLLQLLRCLHTGSSLRWADARLLERINRAIADGALSDLEGTAQDRRLEKMLVNEDHSYAYAVVDGVYRLIERQAIPLIRIESPERTEP